MGTKEYLPKKISLALNSPDLGGRNLQNAARFSGVTRKVLSTQNIPCCVQKNTSLLSIRKYFEQLKRHLAVY